MEEIYDETISDSEIDDILGIENDPVEGDVATESIDAAVRGVGSIKYKGSPTIKSLSKKGVGTIKNI